MKRIFVRISGLLLAFICIWSTVPLGAFAERIPDIAESRNEEKTTYLLAGSDFQPEDDQPATGAARVSDILRTIRTEGYTRMDGFLFAGDYDYNAISGVQSLQGLQALRESVREVYGSDMNEVYVQGNHDPSSLIADGTLSPSGANDTEAYGVFVIHEKDYMWYNSSPETIRKTADSLRAYLEEKTAEDYRKPIFVVSHLPLHYSMRTYYEGDGQYASYLFEVLNEAGGRGLNVIYLFGHNHSHGWDDYLGGASIYLEAGDGILIAQESKTDFTEETLTFTYMNAGYVGCYGRLGSGVDSALTMTVFEIRESRVIIRRYDQDGLHDLKSAGRHGAEIGRDYEKNAYAADQRVYESPRVLRDYPTATDPTGAVTVKAPNVTGVTLLSETEESVEGCGRYVTYDIRAEGYAEGDLATVTLRLKGRYILTLPVTVTDLTTGDRVSARIHDGTVTFHTDRLGRYAVAQIDPLFPVSDTKMTEYTVYETVSELKPGGHYVIVSPQSGYSVTDQLRNRLLVLDTSEDWYKHTWLFEAEGDQTYLRVSEEGSYLFLRPFTAELVSNRVGFDFRYYPDTREWTISQKGLYLHRIGGTASTVAGGNADSTEQSNNRWHIYGARTYAPASMTLTASSGGVSLKPGDIWSPTLTAAADGIEAAGCRVVWTVSDPSVLAVEDGGLRALSEGFSTATATLISADERLLPEGPSVTLLVGVSNKRVVATKYDGNTAAVPFGTSPSAPLGCDVEVLYDDGSTETVSVTASMLKGEFNLRKTGVYRGLTVMWRGDVIVDSFTLTVHANNYPNYPKEGGVRVDKTVTDEEFSSSGLLRVELLVSAINARLNGDDGTELLPAVTNGVFTDVLGDGFTLLRGNHQYTVETDGEILVRNLRASVTVLAYDLYTAEDVDGVTVTKNMVGTRKGTYRILETVTFNQSGTEAYSDAVEGNLLEDGVLRAQTFTYHFPEANPQRAMDLGDSNSLCWRVGTLENTEVTLVYYAYLEGSVEGERETGDCTVGQNTVFRYDNWVGNSCSTSVGSPTVFWTQSTEKNGIYGDYFYADGVRQKGMRLVAYEGQHYLLGEDGRLVRNERVRLTDQLVEGFALSDGTPLTAGMYRFDAEGRLIYPPEPESEPESEPETRPDTEPVTETEPEPETEPGSATETEPASEEIPADTREENPETVPPESETETAKKGCRSALSAGGMGLAAAFAVTLAVAAAACLGKREEN